jgi:tetratricopeptide (TPR) repeat protein
MLPLESPDIHHLTAAMGWLELGNPVEAGEEIRKISASNLEHPGVLEARWQICAALKSWEAALEVAEILISKVPGHDSAWLHRAYALRRVNSGGLQKAWDALRPAYEKFPKSALIPFNLACYDAQLGRLEEAWEWLHKAMEGAKDVAVIKQMALADDDLKNLWDRIKEL